MTHLLENLLTASFHGSIVILAVIAARFILRRTPKKYICLLWLLAFIRLLLPVQIKSELSLQPQITVPSGLTDARWTALIPWIWGAVAVCFGIYSVVSYVRLKKQVREAVRIRGGWECDRIDTAFILGFIKPKIYIPMGMSKQARKHILDHERTHLDKGDHWIKMIGFLALALHWFNPLVWAAYILLCRDIEMACDERVVQFMEPEERKSYSSALLQCSTNRIHFASPVAFGEISVKQRILAVLNYKKHGFWMGLCGVLAIAFVTLCLMTNPAGENDPALTAQQQAQRERIEQCRKDLDDALSRDAFFCQIYEGTSAGTGTGEATLYKLGEDTLWTYHPGSTIHETEGRMVLSGTAYALTDGSWIQTDGPDDSFNDWLEPFRWETEQAIFVEEWTDAYSMTYVTLKIDRDGKSERITCWYNAAGQQQMVRLETESKGTAVRYDLTFPERNPLVNFGYYEEAADIFAEAKGKIAAGTVSAEELIEQKEFREWGVLFRVDDDRLTNRGGDVYIGQAESGRGVLTTTDEYWLEKKVEGAWEKIPTVTEPQWPGGGQGVPRGTSNYGFLDWSALYGELEAGDYRMGKNVHCMDSDNHYARDRAFYAEFTIHETVNSDSPEAAAAVERCYAAWEEVAARDHVHFKTNWGNIEEIWINGGNYLRIREWGEDEQIPDNNGRVDINVVWNGVGYTQVREDPDLRGSKVIGMGLSTLDTSGAVWEIAFADNACTTFNARTNKTASFPEGIGVISDEMVRFVLSWRNSGDKEDNKSQLTYYFDEAGKLIRMEWKALYWAFSGEDDMEPYWAEVYDTSPEEINTVIQSYTVDPIVEPFSWEETQAKYTDDAFNIREDSFVNNGGTTVTDCIDAAKLALKEYPNLGEYLTITVFRDAKAGMWKVTIKAYVTYQATMGYRDIYLTDDGQTKLLVYEGPLGYDEPRK